MASPLSQLPSELKERIIKIQSTEGDNFEITAEICDMCNTVKNLLRGSGKRTFRNSLGGSFAIEDNHAILKKEGRILASLLEDTSNEAVIGLHDVKTSTLARVMDYCNYHTTSNASEKDKKSWNAQFVQVEQNVLCELASASYFLDIKSLVNLTSRAIATQVSGKSTDEIRETFYNNSDLCSPQLATRFRLQKKVKIKKQEEHKPTVSPVVMQEDDRDVDELLSFINSSSDTPNKQRERKKRKQKQRKEQEQQNTPDSLKQRGKPPANENSNVASDSNNGNRQNKNLGQVSNKSRDAAGKPNGEKSPRKETSSEPCMEKNNEYEKEVQQDKSKTGQQQPQKQKQAETQQQNQQKVQQTKLRQSGPSTLPVPSPQSPKSRSENSSPRRPTERQDLAGQPQVKLAVEKPDIPRPLNTQHPQPKQQTPHAKQPQAQAPSSPSVLQSPQSKSQAQQPQKQQQSKGNVQPKNSPAQVPRESQPPGSKQRQQSKSPSQPQFNVSALPPQQVQVIKNEPKPEDNVKFLERILQVDPEEFEEIFEQEEESLDPEFKARVDREVEEWQRKLDLINNQRTEGPKIKLPIATDIFMAKVVGVR